MAVTLSKLSSRLAKQAAAWKELAPDDQFAGMGLAAFEAVLSKGSQVQKEVNHLTALLRAALKRRREYEREAMAVSKRVALAMKSHPAHGEDSPLVRASGFVTESERRSGLTRKNKTAKVGNSTHTATA